MKISVFGDSVSTFHGYNPEGYYVYYDVENAMDNGLAGVEDTWWHKVITLMGGELLVNASFSGSRVSGSVFPASNTYERIDALGRDDAPDIILVYLGFNDYAYCEAVHPETDDSRNFYSAYKTMLERIRERYPDSRIICGTLMKTYITYRPDLRFTDKNEKGVMIERYNEVICAACKETGTETADLAGTGAEYETLDGAHPTDRGHREIAKAWEECLRNINIIR